MGKLNFFAEKEALAFLADRLKRSWDRKPVEFTLDPIEIPCYVIFALNQEKMTMKLCDRGALYSHSGDSLALEVTVEKELLTDLLKGKDV